MNLIYPQQTNQQQWRRSFGKETIRCQVTPSLENCELSFSTHRPETGTNPVKQNFSTFKNLEKLQHSQWKFILILFYLLREGYKLN